MVALLATKKRTATATAKTEAERADNATNAAKVSENCGAAGDAGHERRQEGTAGAGRCRRCEQPRAARVEAREELEKKAETARAAALASEQVERSTASAYQSQTALPSAPRPASSSRSRQPLSIPGLPARRVHSPRGAARDARAAHSPGRRHADTRRELQPRRQVDPVRRRRRCADLQRRLGGAGREARDGEARRPCRVLARRPHDRDRGAGAGRALGRDIVRTSSVRVPGRCSARDVLTTTASAS